MLDSTPKSRYALYIKLITKLNFFIPDNNKYNKGFSFFSAAPAK